MRQNKMAALDQQVVRSRMEAYDSTDVTDSLYDMGKILVNESTERFNRLDAKATRIAGYTGAIIGLMVSTFPIWTSAVAKWAVFLIAVGSLIGLVGGGIALVSTWPQKVLLPSDTDWLEEDGLQNPDRLKRYYVSSMHQVITSQEQVNAFKVQRIKAGQLCLALMILSLLAALGNATYRVIRWPSQPFLGRGASTVLGVSRVVHR